MFDVDWNISLQILVHPGCRINFIATSILSDCLTIFLWPKFIFIIWIAWRLKQILEEEPIHKSLKLILSLKKYCYIASPMQHRLKSYLLALLKLMVFHWRSIWLGTMFNYKSGITLLNCLWISNSFIYFISVHPSFRKWRILLRV